VIILCGGAYVKPGVFNLVCSTWCVQRCDSLGDTNALSSGVVCCSRNGNGAMGKTQQLIEQVIVALSLRKNSR